MKSNTTFWNVGKAGVIALSVLAAFATLLVFVPADAHAASKGAITFCKMIADEDGDIVTDDDGLPQGDFSVRLNYRADNDSATTTYTSVDFGANDFNPNRAVLVGTNDAECITYSRLSFGTYKFGEEEIDESENWKDARYHVSTGEEPESMSDFGSYDGGILRLDDEDPTWTVTILNRVEAEGNEDNDGDDDTDGVNLDADFRITDIETVMTLPGVALFTWETDKDATSMVVYGTSSVSDRIVRNSDTDDNFGYTSATVELKEGVRDHSVAVAGLLPGTRYYMRAVSSREGESAVSEEITIDASVAATSMVRYLNGNLSLGAQNDVIEVMKLQTFLRSFSGYDVETNGIFDQKTLAAVKRFQATYSSEILAPWGYTEPTGNVYILTSRKINEIVTGTTVPLTAAEEREIAAFRAQGAQRPTGTIASAPARPAPVATTTVPDFGTTTMGEQFGLGTSTATSTRLDRGVLGNLASAVFSLPENGTELTRCIFNLIIILAIIYIITSILVPNEDADMSRSRSKVRKTMFFLAGTIIALAFALFFDMFCLVAPLLLALVILIVMFIMQKMGGGEGNGVPTTAPLIIDNSKRSETSKTETTTTTTKVEEKK